MQPYILVMEDEDALATLLQYNLEKEGYRVVIAADGDEGMLQIDETLPDLVLLDWMLPGLSGIEVCRRIRAVLRRIRPGLADDRINHGDIVIDRVAHRVRRAGNEIHLGPTEFRLLDHLMQHPGRVFSREQLLDAVWGSDVYVEARTVDVHVGRLRKALNVEGTVNPIRTVRSAGYSLDLGG